MRLRPYPAYCGAELIPGVVLVNYNYVRASTLVRGKGAPLPGLRVLKLSPNLGQCFSKTPVSKSL